MPVSAQVPPSGHAPAVQTPPMETGFNTDRLSGMDNTAKPALPLCNRRTDWGAGQLSIIRGGKIAWLEDFHLSESSG